MTYDYIYIFKKEAEGKSRNYSECTVNTYLTYINKYLESLNGKDLCDTTERDARKFMSNYEDKSDLTFNLVLMALNSFYDIMIGAYQLPENYVTINPFSRINSIKNPKKEEKKAITEDDYNKLIAFCKNSRDRAILTFLKNTGVRIEELINLTYEQYVNRSSDDKITLTVTKRSKIRSIYLNSETINAIEDYLVHRKEGCEYLFVSNCCKKMCENSIWATIKVIARRAKLDDDVISNLSAHSFRHTAITNWANEGVPLQVIATIVGHSQVNTTMGYVDRNKIDIKKVMCG